MAELKHVGRIKATNKKVLVAYRTLPGESGSALVVPTENMPDIYHDAVINLVESSAAQESYEFAEALDRTQFPDGSRMLPWLHHNGRLIKVPTDAVEMTPTTGFGILLSELNAIIAEQRGVAIDELALHEGINDKKMEVKKTAIVTDTTAEVLATPDLNDPVATAKHYRSQADKLAKDAANFRRMAEELVPTKKKIQ
jgi:hypothetical protein